MQRKGASKGRGNGTNRSGTSRINTSGTGIGQSSQNNQSRRTVQTASGVRMPRPNGRQRARRVLQRVVILSALLAVLILGIYGLTQWLSTTEKPTRLGCLPTDRIEAFGEDMLYYNSGILTCVGSGGSIRWTFHLGEGADFYAADRMIVAWSANQLYVINAAGNSSYNNRMTDNVQFARVGESYVAAFLGTESSGVIQVMSHQGAFVESITVSNLAMMDIGFFGNRGQRMWTLGLDVLGTAPTTFLSTYQPGSLATGAASLSDRMVYRIYMRDNYLMLVDTQSITAYDYKCTRVSSMTPALIYGWQYADSKTVGSECYALLSPTPDDDGTLRMRSLRLMTKTGDTVLRLPTSCFDARLGSHSIYAFSNNAVYYARYGQATFKMHALGFAIDRVLGIMDGNRAIVASGLDVYIIPLPKN